MPPAALAIHLCIGMSYGFSVFWLPLSKAIGIKESIACAKDMGFFDMLFTTTCDWKVPALLWTFKLFFVALGMAAASSACGCQRTLLELQIPATTKSERRYVTQ